MNKFPFSNLDYLDSYPSQVEGLFMSFWYLFIIIYYIYDTQNQIKKKIKKGCDFYGSRNGKTS